MKSENRLTYLLSISAIVMLLLSANAMARQFASTPGEMMWQSFLAADSTTLDSLVAANRYVACREIQHSLESYFETQSDRELDFASALSQVIATLFGDSYGLRQVVVYRSWSPTQRERRQRLNRDFANLTSSGLSFTPGELREQAEKLAGDYLALGDSAAAAKVCQNSALILTAMGGRRPAQQLLRSAEDLCLQIGDLDGLARSYNLWGNYYSHSDDLLAAGAYFDSARVVRTVIGDDLGVAECLNNIANVYLDLGESVKAQRFYEETLRLRSSQHDSTGSASVLLSMVTAFYRQQPDSVVDSWLDQADELLRDNDDPTLMSRFHQAAGLIEENGGELSAALAQYDSALAILPSNLASRLHLSLSVAAARLHNQLGHYGAALEMYLSALSLATRTFNKAALANIYLNLGVSYHRLGDPETALGYYHQALAAYKELQQPCELVALLNNMAELYLYTGDSESANEYVSQAHSLLDHCADPATRARTYITLRNQSSEYLDSAAAIYRENEDRQGLLDVLMLKADDSRRRHDLEAAKSSLCAAGPLAESLKSYANSQKYDLMSGQIAYDADELDTAYAHLARVIGRLEDSRRDLPDAELRTYQQQSNRFVYEMISSIFAIETESGDSTALDSLFKYMQLSKSRTLLDRLHSGSAGLESAGDPVLNTRYQALLDSIDAGEQLLVGNLTAKARDSLSAALVKLSRALREVRLRMNLANPRLNAVYSPPAKSVVEIQAELPDSSALLSYLLTPDKSLLLVVTKSDANVFILTAREQLVNEVIEYLSLLRQSVSEESLLPKLTTTASSLAIQIYGEFADDIGKFKSVYISTDGPLALLPFGTLIIDGKYLIESTATNYLLAPAFLDRDGDIPATLTDGRLLAVADPEFGHGLTSLPYSRKEAEWIASLFPPGRAEVLSGADAVKPLLISSAIEKFDFLHFATHSTINHVDPSRSKLWLARDTSSGDNCLTLREVMQLKLSADLVVLSSCESGSGRYNLGEGFEGFVNGFIYAGAANVLVSLWPVEDFTTSVFMKQFYEHLDSGYAEALRQAKLEMLKSARLRHRHPFFWSPFVLVMGPVR